MCKHQGSSEQSGSCSTLQFLVAEQKPVRNNMAVHPTWKKENNSAEKEGFLSLSLFPFPLARNKENGKIESRILIGCTPFTIIPF